MVSARDVSRDFPQEDFADATQVFDVSAGSHLVKVKGGRAAFAEPRLNPVDGAGAAVEARPHRQGDAEHSGTGGDIGEQLFGLGHRFAVDCNRVEGVRFGIPTRPLPGKH